MRGGPLLACLIAVCLSTGSVAAGADPSTRDKDPGTLEPVATGDDPLPWPWTQDDAGSGKDAPHHPVPEVWITPGEVYEGTLAGIGFGADSQDHYAFWGEAGDVVRAKAHGVLACYEITDESGERIGDYAHCTLAGWDAATADLDQGWKTVVEGHPIEVALEQTGVHYLKFVGFNIQQYRFGLGIDGPPADLGAPLPPLAPGAPECTWVLADGLCQVPPDLHSVCDPVLSDSVCQAIPEV